VRDPDTGYLRLPNISAQCQVWLDSYGVSGRDSLLLAEGGEIGFEERDNTES
jgi:hypothetical protein